MKFTENRPEEDGYYWIYRDTWDEPISRFVDKNSYIEEGYWFGEKSVLISTPTVEKEVQFPKVGDVVEVLRFKDIWVRVLVVEDSYTRSSGMQAAFGGGMPLTQKSFGKTWRMVVT